MKSALRTARYSSIITISTRSCQLNPFHLAIPVKDLEESKEFYGNILGLPEGRSDPVWQDYSLFGHQLVIHKVDLDSQHTHLQDVGNDFLKNK